MADIQIICSACGQSQTVSEYAQESRLTCPACGQSLAGPEAEPRKIGLAGKQPEPFHEREQTIPMSAVPLAAERRSRSTVRDIQRVKASRRKIWLSILVFLALAGALGFLRFYGEWPFLPRETLKHYGRWAIACAYLLIIGLAVKDNMFDGLLAIVVPLYPFYYLFLLSGAVFLRAIVGALVVVFGYDALVVLQGWSSQVIDAVNRWIERTGG